MHELRQVAAYVFALVLVVTLLSAGAVYAVLEGVQYVPRESHVSSAKKRLELARGELDVKPRAEGPPVWIAPTPKYDYDPKLMIVKPREERLKEAELKRKQQAAKYRADPSAKNKARRKVAQQRRDRQAREGGSTYAYQPEVRTPAFGIFSIFR